MTGFFGAATGGTNRSTEGCKCCIIICKQLQYMKCKLVHYTILYTKIKIQNQAKRKFKDNTFSNGTSIITYLLLFRGEGAPLFVLRQFASHHLLPASKNKEVQKQIFIKT